MELSDAKIRIRLTGAGISYRMRNTAKEAASVRERSSSGASAWEMGLWTRAGIIGGKRKFRFYVNAFNLEEEIIQTTLVTPPPKPTQLYVNKVSGTSKSFHLLKNIAVGRLFIKYVLFVGVRQTYLHGRTLRQGTEGFWFR